MVRRTSNCGARGYASKRDLCDALNWSRPTLDAHLLRDRNFPVIRRGSRGVEWQFDTEDVLAYLRGNVATAGSQGDTHPVSREGSGTRVVHVGEATSRQRRDIVQAEILEEKLRRDRGELVLSADVKRVLSTILTHIGTSLDRFGGQLARHLNTSTSGEAAIRALLDELKSGARHELRSLLGDPPR
jgi:phage terminase Nu1 subunit (DNA packaging protein)